MVGGCEVRRPAWGVMGDIWLARPAKPPHEFPVDFTPPLLECIQGEIFEYFLVSTRCRNNDFQIFTDVPFGRRIGGDAFTVEKAFFSKSS